MLKEGRSFFNHENYAVIELEKVLVNKVYSQKLVNSYNKGLMCGIWYLSNQGDELETEGCLLSERQT